MIWINFLHFYQPANSDPYQIDEAVKLSYCRLLAVLEKNQNLKFTVNFSACLLFRFEQSHPEIIPRISRLIERKQLEVVSTAAYHPLMPLISPDEMRRQIIEQEQALKRLFGLDRPRGFFLPEMSYSTEVGKLLLELGYEWVCLDQVSVGGAPAGAYVDAQIGLKAFVRDSSLSRTYPPKHIIQNRIELALTATDAELYGKHYLDLGGSLEVLSSNEDLETLFVSEYMDSQELISIDFLTSSWESLPQDIANGRPFRLWQDENNEIHSDLWKFAVMVERAMQDYASDANAHWIRWHYVRGLASCTFWWASAHDFKEVFGPKAWNPDNVVRGAEEFIRAIRSIHDHSSRKVKMEAENIYADLLRKIWQAHWQNHWYA